MQIHIILELKSIRVMYNKMKKKKTLTGDMVDYGTGLMTLGVGSMASSALGAPYTVQRAFGVGGSMMQVYGVAMIGKHIHKQLNFKKKYRWL